MKKNMKTALLTVTLLLLSVMAYSQSIIGTWKTIDDETGKAKSHVQIYESGGKYYGKITKLLITPENNNCVKCKGSKKDKPLIGLVILENMVKDGDEWTDGTIVNPKDGKEYSCTITMENKDKIKVRGYVGISLFGKTQYWTRVK